MMTLRVVIVTKSSDIHSILSNRALMTPGQKESAAHPRLLAHELGFLAKSSWELENKSHHRSGLAPNLGKV